MHISSSQLFGISEIVIGADDDCRRNNVFGRSRVSTPDSDTTYQLACKLVDLLAKRSRETENRSQRRDLEFLSKEVL